jgi:hypothetical protein
MHLESDKCFDPNQLSLTDVISIDLTEDNDFKLYSIYSHNLRTNCNIKVEYVNTSKEMITIKSETSTSKSIKCENISISKFASVPIEYNRNTIQRRKRLKKEPKSNYDLTLLTTLEEQILEQEQRKYDRKYEEAEFRCDMCFLPFKHCLFLQKHMEKHSEVRNNNKYLIRNMTIDLFQARGSFVCLICKMRFSTDKRLSNHMRESHSCKLNCIECGIRFCTRGSLTDHFAWHEGRTFKCQTCEFTYK